MADNISVRDASGSSVTIRSKDLGSSIQATAHTIVDASGTLALVGDTAANAIYVRPCNGTQSMPSGDAAARKIFVTLTDGTGTAAFDNSNTTPKVSLYGKGSAAGDTAVPSADTVAHALFAQLSDATTGPVAVKAASTAAGATDKALVVSLSPNSPAATNADGVAAGGTLATKCHLVGAQFLAYGSLPALTTGQGASLQSDAPGNLKVAVAPMGIPIYGTASSGGAAAANVSLTIPAAKMGYLDGFDIDGLGATAGSAIAVTVTGLLGGTLTFQVGIPAGATVPYHQSFRFNPPLQGSAAAQAIAVNVPSFGTGNTASSTNAYGHYV